MLRSAMELGLQNACGNRARLPTRNVNVQVVSESNMSKVEKHAILHVVPRRYFSSAQAYATCGVEQPGKFHSAMSTISRGKATNSLRD